MMMKLTLWHSSLRKDNHDDDEAYLVALLLVEEGCREREPVRASRAHQLSTLGGKGGIFSNLAMMIVFIDDCVFVFLHNT